MGFLDKLFGRAKDTAGEAADAAVPVAEEAQDAAGRAWDEASETAGDDEVRETFRRFVEHGVAFTIATDGPEMMRTHLRDELELLERIGALDASELSEANARGHAASFIRER